MLSLSSLVSLITPGSGKTFIETTYELYKRHFGKYFGSVIKGFFCDEPCNFSGVINGIFFWKGCKYKTSIPWVKDMEKNFFERYGYDIKELIPALFYYTGNDKASKKAREDFARLLTEMLKKNFFLSVKNWCKENGVLFTGHFNNDDLIERHLFSTGDLLVQMKVFDIPGIDIICQQIMPEKEKARFSHLSYNAFPYNTNMAKFASSAARQSGSPYALSEIMATYGCGTTIEDTKWVIDHHLIRGVYLFTPATSEYIWGTDNLSFVAAFGFQSPQWLLFPELIKYLDGFIKLVGDKTPVVDTGLWYPITSLWREESKNTGLYFEALMEYLLMNGEDFDIVSPNEIDKFQKGDGYIKYGYRKYTQLIIPPLSSLSEKEKTFIENFGKDIKVYAPALLNLKNTIHYSPDLSSKYHKVLNPLGSFARMVYRDLGRKMSLLPPCDEPSIKIRKIKDRRGLIYFVFNESGERHFKGYIKLREECSLFIVRYRNEGFTIYALHHRNSGYYLEIAPGETAFIFTFQPSGEFTSEKIYNRKIKLHNRWKASIVFEIGWNKNGYYIKNTKKNRWR
ncbi:MAG: hypothetical protein NC905_00695 [Candidatus Omnitrophica bacterium]|nr:hypothetical protein [Candidatus Omnitrophota bacterium]MCM8776773.1 hypothetical protein [Candidatus Omnitrophota bacterium]